MLPEKLSPAAPALLGSAHVSRQGLFFVGMGRELGRVFSRPSFFRPTATFSQLRSSSLQLPHVSAKPFLPRPDARLQQKIKRRREKMVPVGTIRRQLRLYRVQKETSTAWTVGPSFPSASLAKHLWTMPSNACDLGLLCVASTLVRQRRMANAKR